MTRMPKEEERVAVFSQLCSTPQDLQSLPRHLLVTLVAANLQDICAVPRMLHVNFRLCFHLRPQRSFNTKHHVLKQDTRGDFFALLRTKLAPLLPKKVASLLIELRLRVSGLG